MQRPVVAEMALPMHGWSEIGGGLRQNTAALTAVAYSLVLAGYKPGCNTMRSPLSFRKQTSLEIGTARHGMAWKSAPQVAEAAQDHADKQKRAKAAQAQAKKPRHKIPAEGPETSILTQAKWHTSSRFEEDIDDKERAELQAEPCELEPQASGIQWAGREDEIGDEEDSDR